MQSKISNRILSIISGILFTLFLISLGLIFTIHFRPLYYHDIHALHIVESSGYEENVIRENYDALIDYCSPWYQGDLSFPSLPSSKEALQHFVEVKQIFVAFYYLLVISLILLLPIIRYFIKQKNYRFLQISSLTTILLPLLVGAGCAINFDRAFVLFHKLFFRNDYWLFDPVTDPIIELLPSEFFLHCAFSIISIVLVGSLLLWLSSLFCKKKYHH